MMGWSASRYAKLLARGLKNIVLKRPISVSFEITHQCSADCKHCNWGGRMQETKLTPKEYGEICRELKPVIAHLSGGEPTLRTDLLDIISELSNPRGVPLTQLITHGAKLTAKRYNKWRAAGLDRLCVSLDFPDERHDEWRHIPGLFGKLSENLPQIAAHGRNDISVNCCITAANALELPEILKCADSWNVPVNFSAYTPLRTGDLQFLPESDDLASGLTESIKEVVSMRRAGYRVISSEKELWKYRDFLLGGKTGKCMSGYKFLVIIPDGRFAPCAMVHKRFRSQKQMVREFSKSNDCRGCFIATRGDTEKTIAEFLVDMSEYLWGKAARKSAGRVSQQLPVRDDAA